MDAQELRNLQEAYLEVVMNEGLGGAQDPDRVQRRLDQIDADIKGQEMYDSGKLPYQQQQKAKEAQEFLKKHPRKKRTQQEQVDIYDIILSHLLDEGYAETPEAAERIMVNMSEEWKRIIVEDGFNSSGRYDVGGGRTVGPVSGAVHALFSGNLPKSRTYVPPTKQTVPNRPPTVPASKGDSGKLTDFGAGGGKAKLKTGMSVGQVERQGRMNMGDYSL